MACFASRSSFVNGGLSLLSMVNVTDEDCFICLQPYRPDVAGLDQQESEDPTKLPCGHLIGRECILRWTQESNTCPFCRAVLFETEAELCTNADDTSIFEPIGDWERVWYESMGIDLAYVPFGYRDDHLDPLNDSDSYAPQQTVSQIPVSRHVSVSVERCRCEHRQPHREAQCGITDANVSLVSNSAHDTTPFTIPEMIWDATESNMPDISQQAAQACSVDSPVDLELEWEITASDVSMADLISGHERWMTEFASAMEVDF